VSPDVAAVRFRGGVLLEATARNANPSGTHDTQEDAWNQATQLARQNRSEALLHGRDGQIRERNTYREDPVQSKG
jgi:hypothetical protein